MTAKTLEKSPVTLGGFVHPLSEDIYSLDDSTPLPGSVAIFPNSDLGGHYDQLSGISAGKLSSGCARPPTCFHCHVFLKRFF